MLRAIGYLRQAGTTFSDRYVEQALVGHPRVARLLVDLVLARFDPETADLLAPSSWARRSRRRSTRSRASTRTASCAASWTWCGDLRTNFFQRAPDGTRKPYLSFKLDPEQLAWLPLPRPRFEIFVYSPRTEGVHLRGGKVARGGIRWSDRREDFRTEVLGLMKAQMVKNAVIVPVGAKGGFVLKRPPPGDDRDALLAEVEACYRTFISGLLDLTDNIVGNEIEPPPDVVRYDEDDLYLVVAADKGTATLSDVANEVAGEYGLARRRVRVGRLERLRPQEDGHHRARRLGVGQAPLPRARPRREGAGLHGRRHRRHVGDVFGNGMLLSKHIRLIGAFDHRHVFLDPEPDAARSWEERERLFKLARSSWDDYDRDLISEGGGVYSRTAKSIPLSPQVRAALDVRGEALAPNELIRRCWRRRWTCSGTAASAPT